MSRLEERQSLKAKRRASVINPIRDFMSQFANSRKGKSSFKRKLENGDIGAIDMNKYYGQKGKAIESILPYKSQLTEEVKKFIEFLDQNAIEHGKGKASNTFFHDLIKNGKDGKDDVRERFSIMFKQFKKEEKEMYTPNNCIEINKERYKYIDYMINN